jgi:Protein of unknown function (DUF1419)
MPVTADTTLTIYCTRTHRVIDTCLPGQEAPEGKLARHAAHYGPDLVILPFDEAWKRHEAAFKTEPTEVMKAHWHEMLNILPPVAWRRDGFGESFKMSERTTGAITAIYVLINGRHFTFSDDIRTPHAECCRRVFQSPAYRGDTVVPKAHADGGSITDPDIDRA